MRLPNAMIFLVVINLLTLHTSAQPILPGSGYPTDPFSPADFQERLSKLRTEREGLDADWNALTRKLAKRSPGDGPDIDKLHLQLKQTLTRLQQDRLKSLQPLIPGGPKPETPNPEVKPLPELEPKPVEPGPTVNPPSGPVDVLHLGQILLRAGRHEEALEAFKQVDLKGRKAEERIPIVYMTANCLYQLGKTEDAFRMLRDAANSRGDERFANYAQWQMDSLRWHRGVEGKLEEIRQRRMAAEKK